MLNIWQKLKKPIIALAPMEEVTDSALRQIIIEKGRPDILFTWFVSTDGLISEGKERVIKDLYFDKKEHPIIAQIFGNNPDNFYKTAKLLKKMKFDGIDINMGCPVKKVIKQGVCSALIDKPELAKEIILATKKGAGGLPVSVKTRLGTNKNTIDKWISTLIEVEPAAITLHGRTSKEMSKVPNNFEEIGRVAQIIKAKNPHIIFLGNGDIKSVEEGKEIAKKYNLDGVMLGHAIFGNPWLFSKHKKEDLPFNEIAKTLIKHTKLFAKLHSHRNFNIMKKHFASYIEGFAGAKELRAKLMTAKNSKDVEKILKNLI